jgi:hypothetical protein
LIPQWVREDNARRAEAYRKDDTAEAFLFGLNEALAPAESTLEAPAQEPFPLLFIVGVPRAGKTLLAQVMASCLDVGYIDNLAARFWRAPVHGIRLSATLRTRRPAMSFDSDYGKTTGVHSPHDFSYFWHYWLAMKTMPYDPNEARGRIRWADLRRELMRISAAFGRAGMFKSPNPGYHITELAGLYRTSFFIYVQRDHIDSAVSLCRGRRDNFGNLENWYGQWPARYEHLLDLPPHEQVAGQIAALTEMFETQLTEIEPRQVIRGSYAALCADPRGVLDGIVTAGEAATGHRIAGRAEPPESFALSRHDESGPDYEPLLRGLEQFGLPARFTTAKVPAR